VIENLVHGLTSLGNGQAIAYLVGGSLVGMFLGVIPGLGGAVVLSIILAFVYHVSVTGAICLFLAVHAASYFSASVTSILLNTPAHPEAFAVTFDGFPMAQRGEAGRALGISATSTMIGGLIGCACLVGFIQVINYLPTLFHPPEYVALISIALILVGTLGTDAASKALISAGIGLMIASIGTDPVSGVGRFVFGSVGLISGVSLVALALGLFAIPQMVLGFGTGRWSTRPTRWRSIRAFAARSSPVSSRRSGIA
jgi:putative tricarboxylic transport membrane protein